MKRKLYLRVVPLLVCLLSFLASHAQIRKITGIISDDKGAPLSGATISVKNTQISTFTNEQGAYTINVPATSKILVVSYVGSQPKEMTIGAENTLNVKLETSSNNLNEVVVVGYGTARKVNLTTAQTTVSAKDIDRTVNTTVEQALQGRAAGVYVTQNSGQPGGGLSVTIRGISSINGGTEPLYVIDGVQIEGSNSANSSGPLAGLNPTDIEDMQILQGPSATAIYGSRGTNGVVLITTKRGKSGEAKMNYGVQYNIQTPPKRFDVMSLQQYAQMQIAFKAIAGGVVRGELLDPSILGPGTDWQRELFNNAAMQKHQLSVSGGSNNTTYFMSGEYLKQDGVAVGSGFDRYSFRVNLDNKPREWISLSTNLSFNQTNENTTTSSSGLIGNAIQLSPEVPVKNLNGSWGGGDVTNPAHQFAPVNPVAISTLTTNGSVRRQFLGGINLGITIIKGLVVRTSFNTNVSYSNSTFFQPSYSIGWAVNPTSTFQDNTNRNTYWNWNQLAEYNRKFGKHNVGLMVTHEAQEGRYKNLGARRTDYLTNNILDLAAGNAATASNTGGSGYSVAMESYLGRLNYNYDNRYILTSTLRRDGSMNFGSERRWGTFPSLSAAWRVSQEKFFNVPFISEMKVRYELGLTGNQGYGGIYGPLAPGASPFGTSFLIAGYPNAGKKWESTNTNNYGINIGLFKSRVNIDFDYYIKNTSDMLLSASLPEYMGSIGTAAISSPTVNAGSLQTKGWSFTINSTNVSTKSLKWETNLNLSSFKTIIQDLNSKSGFLDRDSWWLNQGDPWSQRSTIGYEPWLFRGYIEEGLFTSVDEINKSPVPADINGNRRPTAPTNGIWIGDIKLKDINGDGVITSADKTFIGNPWPKLFGGLTNSFSYKNFDLSILITGTFGNDVYNFTAWQNANPNNINLGRNMLIEAYDYAKVTVDANGVPVLGNPQTNVSRIISGVDVNGNYARQTSKWVEDGSFVRLKNVTLSYNIPQTLISRQKLIKGSRATFGVQNIATITNYSGFDPEVGAYTGANAGNAGAIGLDNGRYPLTPIYTFSLNVNF